MPANNSNAHKIEGKYPGRMGLLIGPGGWRDPKGLPFALDNGRFAVWSRGKEWDQRELLTIVLKASDLAYNPRWIVVPDVVGDAAATFDEWNKWYGCFPRGWCKALAVQDGMTPDSVRRYTNPDVLFVGGTTEWKRRTLWNWCREFPRVHVGRVNHERWLWNAHRSGAESTDGTGWFRGDQVQLRGLLRYLKRSSAGIGPAQLELEFARTFGGTVPAETFVR